MAFIQDTWKQPLDFQVETRKPLKGREAGSRHETKGRDHSKSTVSISHEGSLVKHTLWFVHEIISVLVSTGLKAQ